LSIGLPTFVECDLAMTAAQVTHNDHSIIGLVHRSLSHGWVSCCPFTSFKRKRVSVSDCGNDCARLPWTTRSELLL